MLDLDLDEGKLLLCINCTSLHQMYFINASFLCVYFYFITEHVESDMIIKL